MLYTPSFAVTTSDLLYIKYVKEGCHPGGPHRHYIQITRQNCQQTITLNDRNDNWSHIYSEAKKNHHEEFLFVNNGFINKKFITGMMNSTDGNIVVCFDSKTDGVYFQSSDTDKIIHKWVIYHLEKTKTKNKKSETDNKEPLIEKISELIEALTYAPGGLIAQKAGEDFSKLIKS